MILLQFDTGVDVELDPKTLSESHARWIERKRAEREELVTKAERLLADCNRCGESFVKRGERVKLCPACRSDAARAGYIAAGERMVNASRPQQLELATV